MRSVTDNEPGIAVGASGTAGKDVRLTVTGLDEKGQMFRESAPILEILGRDCVYRSKFQPEQESWVLIEFDGSVEGSKRTTVQGQVKSVQPDAFEANAYRIYVQLESAQGLKIVPPAQPPKTTTPAAPTAPVAQNPVAQPPAAPARKADAVRMPKEAFAEPINRAKPDLSVAKPLVIESPLGKAAAPVTREVSAPRPQADAPGWSREAATASVALEVKEQLTALKGSFGEELERIAQREVAASLEPMIRQAVEKQIATNYQTAIQTLNSDLTYQLAGRLANNEEVRKSVENIARKALDEQVGQAQNSAIEDLRTSKADLAELIRTFGKSIAEIESKVEMTGGVAASVLEHARALSREVAESTENLQKVVDQLNQSARSTTEKFDAHMTAQLNTWSAQFKNHVDEVSREKAAQFMTGLQQLSPHVQEANEVLEKLSAGLQLARGGVRMQEAHWAERSRAIAAEFEKEIKSVLTRLAGAI